MPLDSAIDASSRLQWCLTSAISALCHAQGEEVPPTPLDRPREDAIDWQWHRVLTAIDRRTLDPTLRPLLDELLADSLLNTGETQQLLERLLTIPLAESSPRAAQAIETLAMSRLHKLASDRSLSPALDLWDVLIRRRWPSNSGFPAQLTGRLAALVDQDPSRYREPYRHRLIRLADSLSTNSQSSLLADLIVGELKRLETLETSTVSQP
jgi:hypothetical protein